MSSKYKIAVIGGTGAEGSGLAFRLAHAGHDVTIGSRDAQKAATKATELSQSSGKTISGLANADAVRDAELVILTVPFASQKSTAEDLKPVLANKILVDATVPLVPPKVSQVQLPAGGSAVAAVQEMLGDDVRVVSAFQNVSAHHLKDLTHSIECDVLVCGNDKAACEIVSGLVKDVGLRPIYAGLICNSAAAEALTSLLIVINRQYKIPSSGIRITGLPGTV